MRREILIAATLLPLLSCDPREGWAEMPAPPTPEPAEADSVLVEEEALFYSAVSYPEGYDWRSNRDDTEVGCRLLFVRGNDIILDRPAGGEESSSPEPDRHRIIGSDFYEDCNAGDETVIYRNGREIVRLKGCESINDAMMVDSSLFTLGASRQDGGFVLRKDWKILTRSTNIQPASPFYKDGEHLCFSAVSSAEGGGTQWYVVTDGDIRPVSPSGGKGRIQSMITIWGTPAMILEMDGRYYLQIKGTNVLIVQESGYKFFLPVMRSEEGYLFIDGNVYDPNTGKYQYRFWDAVFNVYSSERGFKREASLLTVERKVAVGRNFTDGSWTLIDDFEEIALPAGCRPYPPYPMLLHGDTLCLALVDGDGKALLWENGKIRSLGFNGFVDGLSYSTFTRKVSVKDRRSP